MPNRAQWPHSRVSINQQSRQHRETMIKLATIMDLSMAVFRPANRR
jgi:hypothetical protein